MYDAWEKRKRHCKIKISEYMNILCIQLQPIPALAHWLISVTRADAGCDIEKGMYMYHYILYSICIFDLFLSNIKSETYIYVPD